ncbi:DoxX family protein [Brumimicrobium aurantiacum]|uniref:DoxX family protein n=1 Tax=Brumimicrobium aurantiacum TaxID=1737063 RepID=A0A3E1F0R9_9FLAO|nr:DoxX family protein [Brumimicrobium aurantiacum]RFC55421.1 DoxX family protein [Brumimicrobium aurantiacum]
MVLYSKELRFSKSISTLILRAVLGLTMLFGHGLPKLDVLLGEGEIRFADPLGIGVMLSLILAVFAEVVCSALLAIGLWTRYAVVPLIVTMIIAVFVVHAGDGLGKIELPLLYLAGYMGIFFLGSGKISVDHLIKGNL